MSKEKVLLIYEDNWTDEMDVYAWQITDMFKWESLKDEFLENVGNNEFSFYFGANEDMQYDNAMLFIDQIREQPLTTDEAKSIKKVFGCTEMGQINIIEKLQYGIEKYSLDKHTDSEEEID
jgi:hypothetical protein